MHCIGGIMIKRDDMRALVKMIIERPVQIMGLNAKDKDFLTKMRHDVEKYGYSFSDKQFKWLNDIYRKVYKNV